MWRGRLLDFAELEVDLALAMFTRWVVCSLLCSIVCSLLYSAFLIIPSSRGTHHVRWVGNEDAALRPRCTFALSTMHMTHLTASTPPSHTQSANTPAAVQASHHQPKPSTDHQPPASSHQPPASSLQQPNPTLTDDLWTLTVFPFFFIHACRFLAAVAHPELPSPVDRKSPVVAKQASIAASSGVHAAAFCSGVSRGGDRWSRRG